MAAGGRRPPWDPMENANMTRSYLTLMPAIFLLAACNSPGDGTTRSETETVPAGEGAMASPTDMSTPDAGSSAADGTAGATSSAAPGSGAVPGDTGAVPPGTSTGDMSGSGTEPATADQGTPPPSN